MSQFYIALRGSDRRTERVVTFIHTKRNFKSWHETHQVMMHCFHAILAIGIATLCLGLRRLSFPIDISGPRSLKTFPIKKKEIKKEVAGSCIGQVTLFLSLSLPRCKTRMLLLTFHACMFGRLNSVAAGSEAPAVPALRRSGAVIHGAHR